MKTYGALVVVLIVVLGCQGPEPRRPKEVKSGSYYRESIARNKLLLASEQEQIKAVIEVDSLHDYQYSDSGSWYYYNQKKDTTRYLPRPDDLVTLSYDLRTFTNDTIYSAEEIGIVTYKVDKQELFPGLRNSVKLLGEGESATFLYPSSLGYGYPGDGNRIGVNVPLKSTLVILKVVKASELEEPITK